MIQNIFNKEQEDVYVFNDIINNTNKNYTLNEISAFLKKYLSLDKKIFKSELPLEIKDSSNHKSKYYFEAFRLSKSRSILFFEYIADSKDKLHHLVIKISSKSRRGRILLKEALFLGGFI